MYSENHFLSPNQSNKTSIVTLSPVLFTFLNADIILLETSLLKISSGILPTISLGEIA